MLGVFQFSYKIFGSFGGFFALAPGGVGFTAGYTAERLDGFLDAFCEFGVASRICRERLLMGLLGRFQGHLQGRQARRSRGRSCRGLCRREEWL